MHIHLIAIGKGMPSWVNDGMLEYSQRLRHPWSLSLHEIASPSSAKQGNTVKRVVQEGEKLLSAVPDGARIIALDENGKQWTTSQLAQRWQDHALVTRDIALLVGGADGHSAACLSAADERWSLSAMTLPHMLVRVILAEQVYRIWSVIQHHPYHRDGKVQ